METASRSRAARPCPRCGALNGEGFDRCVRCAAPLQALGVGAEKLGTSLDATKLWGTKTLIGLTALVFAGQAAALARGGLGNILLKGGTRADLLRFGAMPMSLEDVRAEPFRVLSAVFVHIGAIHFGMNMLSLANVGRAVEPGIGSARFVVAYLVAGVVGFAANIGVDVIFPSTGPVAGLTAGASGAVFGVMGLIIGWLFRMRDKRWRSFAIQAAFYALLVNMLGMRINNGAHIGGLLCGVGFGFFYAAYPRPKSLLLPNIVAVAGLVLSILSLVLAQRAAGWGKRPFPTGAAIQPSSPRSVSSLDAAATCACVPRTAAPPLPDQAPLRPSASAPCRADDSAHEVAV